MIWGNNSFEDYNRRLQRYFAPFDIEPPLRGDKTWPTSYNVLTDSVEA